MVRGRSRRGGRADGGEVDLRAEEAPRLFVVAGMPRCGTTSLFHILGGHPDLFAPHRKEVGYFLYNFDRGARWHRWVYRGQRPGQLGLDVTPEYFFDAAALVRLADHRPPVRVALGVRAPAELAVSLFGELQRRRYDLPSFAEFLQGYGYRRRGTAVRFGFAARRVSRALEAYRRCLGDRLLLYDYRQLCADAGHVLRCLEAFLGVRPHFATRGFDNVFLNAADRGNWRPLSYLLAREGLIAILERMLPRPVLLRLTRAFYGAMRSARRRSTGEPPDVVPLEVPAWLAEESAELMTIFARGSVLRGDGAPLPPTASAATAAPAAPARRG